MRIFALGPGRSGSMTFARAAAHLPGFTAGHETGCAHPGDLEYPDNHIEADTHLVWILPALLEKYPEAGFVHLMREREENAHSLESREGMRGWNHLAFQGGATPYEAADSYLRFVHDYLIHRLPLDRTLMVALDTAQEDFKNFAQWLGVEGDVSGALEEYSTKHNATLKEAQP